MKDTKEIEKLFKLELDSVLGDIIWKNKAGDYLVFNRYKIIKDKTSCIVLQQDLEVGTFSSTKTALSWCIADKYKNYRLARDILSMDAKLVSLIADIKTRANLADRSNDAKFQEIVETKLETKIIHKKQLETQLDKCINWAKYWQQRGLNNEIVRTGIRQPIKTSR